MKNILIVDDDQDLRFNLSHILKEEGFNVIDARNGREALKILRESSPDLVLLDMRLPGMDGMKILQEMRKSDKDLIIIMLTAYGDVKGAVSAMKLGAFDYVNKPFDDEELILIIKKALQTQSLSKEVDSLRKKLGEKKSVNEIVGESPSIKLVLKQVEIIASTNMTVLIQGASGTGKELIARLIHQKSLRKDKPFVAIDCGALPETLVESEFFGYEKGAFTGAEDRKDGKFEQANGGTLFLDEITNLSEAAQMKLLRVIQERKLQHLGGKRDISIDVRIVVASNVILSEQVRKGRFRDDLYHRLNEFQIDLPKLAERKEDIPILAKYFLEEANSEFNKEVKGFSPGTMKYILNQAWPGNIRELRNVTRRAVLLAESDIIEFDYLFINQLLSQLPNSEAVDTTKPLDKLASFEEDTQEFQKGLIKRALEEAGGKKLKAAELLKMNKKTLYRKIKNLKL